MADRYNCVNWKAIHNELVTDFQTMCLTDVAKKHNVNKHTLMSYCSRNDIDRPVRKSREPKVKLEQYPLIKQLHLDGKSAEEIGVQIGYSKRAVNVALGNLFQGGEDAKTSAERVYVSDFRAKIGPWLDICFGRGHIVIKSEKRGEMVLMSAEEFNEMQVMVQEFKKKVDNKDE